MMDAIALSNNTFNFTEPVQCEINASAARVFYAIFMSLVMVLSLCGNVLVIVAIIMSPILKGRATSLFIASLACSDFYFAFSLIPIKISTGLHDSWFCHSLPICYWYIMSDALSNTASIINLLAIALDRFIAIKSPYIYAEKVTNKRVRIVVVGIWLFACFCVLISLFRWSDNSETILSINIGRMCNNTNYYYYMVVFFAIYFTSLLLMSGIYATILHIALSHIKVIESTNIVLQNNSHNEPLAGNGKANKVNRRRKRELKTTKSLAMVYGAFVICWLPSCIVNIINFFDKNLFFNLSRNNPNVFLFVYYTFTEVLPSVNTAVNPFIYSFSNKQFQSAFKRVFYKMIGKYFPTIDTDFNSSVGGRSPKLSVTNIISRMTPNTAFRKVSKPINLSNVNDKSLMRATTGESFDEC